MGASQAACIFFCTNQRACKIKRYCSIATVERLKSLRRWLYMYVGCGDSLAIVLVMMNGYRRYSAAILPVLSTEDTLEQGGIVLAVGGCICSTILVKPPVRKSNRPNAYCSQSRSQLLLRIGVSFLSISNGGSSFLTYPIASRSITETIL